MTRRSKPHPVPAGFKVLPPVSPFFRSLGRIYIRETGDGSPPIYGLHVRPKHANRHGTGHGGFLATLADTFMAAFVHHGEPGLTMWTVRLSMEYKRPAPMGAWLEGHLRDITREGRFITVNMELRVGDTVTNKASAVFSIAETKPAD